VAWIEPRNGGAIDQTASLIYHADRRTRHPHSLASLEFHQGDANRPAGGARGIPAADSRCTRVRARALARESRDDSSVVAALDGRYRYRYLYRTPRRPTRVQLGQLATIHSALRSREPESGLRSIAPVVLPSTRACAHTNARVIFLSKKANVGSHFESERGSADSLSDFSRIYECQIE